MKQEQPTLARNVDIRLRRSSVAGNIPTIEQLNLGELAINTADGKLYLKKQIDGIEQVVEVGADARAGLVSTFNTYIYTSDGTLQSISGADDYGNHLTYDLSSPRRIQVYLNGVLLHQGVDYTSPDGISVVMEYPIDSDQVVQIAAYNSDGASIDADLILDDGYSFTVGTDEETKLYHNGSNTVLKHMAYGDNTFLMKWRDSDRLEMGENGINITGELTINGNQLVTDSDVLVLINGEVTQQYVEDLNISASSVSYIADSAGTGLHPLNATNVQDAIDILHQEKLDITALSSSVVFYPTTVAHNEVPGYNKLVTSTQDPDFNTTPVNVNTGVVAGQDQLVGQLVSDQGVLEGSTGVINIHTVGNIRKATGNSQASFYFTISKMDQNGSVTLLSTSSVTRPTENETYEEFYADALLESTSFTLNDRVVLQFYASDVAGGADASFDLQFGGNTPIRSLFPVPVSVIPLDVRSALSGGAGILYTEATGVIAVDANVISTRNYTEAYAEMQADSALTSANAYTDTQIATLDSNVSLSLTQSINSLQGEIDSDFNAAVDHTNTSVANLSTTLTQYIDSQDASTLNSAISYADSAINVAITDLVDGAPQVLDTLNEIAAALGDDSDFIGTVQNWINQKLDKTATTDDLDEGINNLYHTEQRARSTVSAGNGLIYNIATGEFAVDSSSDVTYNTVTANTFTGDLNGVASDANQLDGQDGSYYRINVYDQTGTLLN